MESEISEIDAKLKEHKENDDKMRKEQKLEHQQAIDEQRAKGKTIKDKLRDKLTFIGK